jgi:hypothetical protein
MRAYTVPCHSNAWICAYWQGRIQDFWNGDATSEKGHTHGERRRREAPSGGLGAFPRKTWKFKC